MLKCSDKLLTFKLTNKSERNVLSQTNSGPVQQIRVRSLMPKILRPTWGNKAKNIKAEKGGAEKKDRKK
jgi:hypothetical protein